MRVEPEEHFTNWQQDAFANYQARLVFPGKTREFKVTVDLVAEMAVYNPFDFFLEPSAETFPFEYDPGLALELAPYRVKREPTPRFAAFVASSKVFSPQYLLWLLPAACAGLVLLDGDDRRRLGRWTAVLVVTAALTHVVFPYAYRALIDGHTGWMAQSQVWGAYPGEKVKN